MSRSSSYHVLLTSLTLALLMIHREPAAAQTEIADFSRMGHAAFLTSTVTDYQCSSINPANLGFSPVTDIFSYSTPLSPGSERSRKPFAIGIGQIGFSARSDALNKPQVLDLLLQRGSATSFTPADQLKAAQAFADRGLRLNVDVMLFGLSYQTKLYGGFAFTAHERVNASFVFNKGASEIIFQGRRADYFDSSYTNWRGDTIGVSRDPKQFSELFNGTRFSMTWMREWALSYGVPVWIGEQSRLCVGVTGKYLQPYAYIDAHATGSAFTAYSSLSPWFNINYGNARTPSQMAGTAFVPVGSGYGADIGLTYQSPTLSIGVSVIDIGSVAYDGNVYSAADTIVNGMGTTGFNSYNLFKEAQKITGEGNYFVWSGLLNTTAKLPTRLRLGANYRLGSRFDMGFDVAVPLADVGTNPQNVRSAAGIMFRPVSWIILATGVGTGDGMALFIPGSITFSVARGFWEFGLSSIDISSLFTDRLPIVSTSFGFLRFRM